MGVSYASQTIVRTAEERLALIRRTYSVVLGGIFVTMLGVAVALTQPAIMAAVIAHPFITFIISFAPLLMAQRTARTFPANIGFTFLFTFLIGLFIAPGLVFAERAQPGVIGQAAILTGAAFSTLTAYAFLSRRDFSAWGSFFMVGLVVAIVTILLNAFVLHSAGVALFLGPVVVLIFSGLLVFDTWRLRNVYGPDDYIPAAINIYLDILNMFLWILQILGGGNRR